MCIGSLMGLTLRWLVNFSRHVSAGVIGSHPLRRRPGVAVAASAAGRGVPVERGDGAGVGERADRGDWDDCDLGQWDRSV